MDSLRVRAERRMQWDDCFALHILRLLPERRSNGDVYMEPQQSYNRDFQLVPLERGRASDPAIILDYHEAQRLMDDLFAGGLRPSEGSGSAGALAATQSHLNDLRTLLYHKTGISKSP